MTKKRQPRPTATRELIADLTSQLVWLRNDLIEARKRISALEALKPVFVQPAPIYPLYPWYYWPTQSPTWPPNFIYHRQSTLTSTAGNLP